MRRAEPRRSLPDIDAFRTSFCNPQRVTSSARGVPLSTLLALALGAATAYLWNFGHQDWGNAYYAGIAQAGSQNLQAAFFGSLDISNVVSTDKPPLAFWPMALSIRVFGLHNWSVLLPQVMESALAVGILAHTVGRVAGRAAGTLAGVLLAMTPIFFALARFNDPDTLLTLMVTLAAFAAVRTAQSPRRRWPILLGLAFGCAFMSKWLVGLLPIPAFAVALWPRLAGRRSRTALLAGATTLVSGLSWVAALAVLGQHRRPYADGSGAHGSLAYLVLGQEATGRLAGYGSADTNGSPGPLRLVNPFFADQIGWLLPVAVLLLLWLLWRRPGGADQRTAVVLFGGWLVVGAVVFSGVGGAMHPYYTVFIAPPIAAVVAIGGCAVLRDGSWWLAPALLLVNAGFAVNAVRITRTRESWLVPAIVIATLVAVVLLVVRRRPLTAASGGPFGLPQVAGVAGLTAAVVSLLAGPVATDLGTVGSTIAGANARAGPARVERPYRYPPVLVDWLKARRGPATWLAAVPTATPAAYLQLQSGDPVLALGGFTGSGQGPSLEELARFRDAGRLRFVLLIGPYQSDPLGHPPGLDRRPLGAMVNWARDNGCPRHVGRMVVVDLEDRSCHGSNGQGN